MTWRPAAAIGVIVLGAALGASRRQDNQRPTFRSTTDSVFVDVSVKNGKVPIAGLGAADFELFDNGRFQQIDAASIEEVPIDVSLAVDLSNSVIGDAGAFRADVRKLAGMLRPVDRVRIVTFATGVNEVVPMQAATANLALDGITVGGATSLNDGLLYTLLWPGELARRHLIIVFTDGEDSFSTLNSDAIPVVADHSNAILHAVLVDGSSDPSPWMQRSRTALVEAARRTGGEVHKLSHAADDFKQIVNDFRTSYVLRFTPRGVKRDGWHELTVGVVSPGADKYTVRARKGYFGG